MTTILLKMPLYCPKKAIVHFHGWWCPSGHDYSELFGPFSPVVFIAPLMLLIGRIASVKRRKILLLMHNSSSNTAKKPRQMSAKAPKNPCNRCLLRFLEMITSSNLWLYNM
jgi:hypothetical protein